MRSSDRENMQTAWFEQLQKRVARLEMENRELRRQLDEVRRGVGIAVLIQGRPIPLAAIRAHGTPLGSDTLSAFQTGSHPAVNPEQAPPWSYPPSPSHVPGPRSRVPDVGPRSGVPGYGPQSAVPYGGSPSMAPTNGPRSVVPNYGSSPAMPSNGPRSMVPEHGPRSVPIADEMWLTGRQRALPPLGAQQPQQAPQSQRPPQAQQARPMTPSQRVTPDWLRDPSPSRQVPAVVPTASATPATPVGTQSVPARKGATGEQQAVQSPRRSRGGSAARPLRTRLEPADVPSLAELTGHHPALRPGNKRSPAERNPFEDSFVLD